jgi:hypothetical protein
VTEASAMNGIARRIRSLSARRSAEQRWPGFRSTKLRMTDGAVVVCRRESIRPVNRERANTWPYEGACERMITSLIT